MSGCEPKSQKVKSSKGQKSRPSCIDYLSKDTHTQIEQILPMQEKTKLVRVAFDGVFPRLVQEVLDNSQQAIFLSEEEALEGLFITELVPFVRPRMTIIIGPVRYDFIYVPRIIVELLHFSDVPVIGRLYECLYGLFAPRPQFNGIGAHFRARSFPAHVFRSFRDPHADAIEASGIIFGAKRTNFMPHFLRRMQHKFHCAEHSCVRFGIPVAVAVVTIIIIVIVSTNSGEIHIGILETQEASRMHKELNGLDQDVVVRIFVPVRSIPPTRPDRHVLDGPFVDLLILPPQAGPVEREDGPLGVPRHIEGNFQYQRNGHGDRHIQYDIPRFQCVHDARHLYASQTRIAAASSQTFIAVFHE
mmetsp:Transcript_30755/g.92140  ORF Transcript_30755/g.92140 Transcript_30755/m.92140 type:complete len:359 (+) Transcript_30755:1593-2669(+)